MKNRKDTSRLTVEIYDEDGVLCESVGGGYTFDELRDMLEDIVKNDGIKFHAAGHPLDVHTANRDLLMRIFEENGGGKI